MLMNGLMDRCVLIEGCIESEASSSQILPSNLASEYIATYAHAMTSIVILVCDNSMSKGINMCVHLNICMLFLKVNISAMSGALEVLRWASHRTQWTTKSRD